MKRRLHEDCITKLKAHRDVLSQIYEFLHSETCAPKHSCIKTGNKCGRMSLCALRGSLTVEAALLMPFFLMVLLACFSFFIRFASAADLKVKAAAEAKKVGVAITGATFFDSAEITIYKTATTDPLWIQPFSLENRRTEYALCRAWIGFTELKNQEIYVYITPRGSVYHLHRDCSHLSLSIQCVTFQKASNSKNEYGQVYRSCELCGDACGALVYITSEGECYHSQRTCSGLKRTIRQIPISQTGSRSCCSRCIESEE